MKEPSVKIKKDRSTSFYKKIYLRIAKYIGRKKKTGFTMIELLVALAIVGTMSTAGAVTFNSSLVKSRDAKRKKDIVMIKISFEDYYNDNDCYPSETILDNCGSSDLAPYMNEIPCDPREKTPYLYVPLSDACDGYRLLADLENDNDVVIAKIGCDGVGDCGWEVGYNYGISVGIALVNPDYVAPPEASPSPSDSPIFVYACDRSGVCNEFAIGNPRLLSCPVTFEATNCNNECGDPNVRCD